MSIIAIELRGFDTAERNLRGFAATMIDLRPFWPKVVPLFVAWMREQFATEGEWGGAPWAELSDTYGLSLGRGITPILVRTEAMRRAASRPRRISTPSMLTLWIDDPKIGYHQTGTETMPARPVIPDHLPASAEADLERAQDLYVADMMRRFHL